MSVAQRSGAEWSIGGVGSFADGEMTRRLLQLRCRRTACAETSLFRTVTSFRTVKSFWTATLLWTVG